MRMFRFALPVLALLSVGCYTLQPTGGPVPVPGALVAFDLNDVGRVAMRDRIGPEVARIEGRLIASENGEHVVAVSSIEYLRGGHEVWRGERIRIGSDHVGTAYERRFSPGRSAVVGAVGVSAFAYFLTRALNAFGEDGDGNGNGGKGGDSALVSRGPR